MTSENPSPIATDLRQDVEVRKLADLRPRPNNPRTHSEEQVAQIAASIRQFGFTNPLLIEADGTIVAGHGRARAAVEAGLDAVPCIVLTGLTPEQVRAYVIADNQLPMNAGWDDAILQAELRSLSEAQFDMAVLGFADAELAAYLAEQSSDESEDTADQQERAQLLARGEITIDEPDADVHAGDTWYLGQHVMVVADVLRQHDRWRHRLQDDVLFAPFAGPFALATEASISTRLLIVQPDTYIAGHIIDRFAEWHPGERIEVQREGESAPAGVTP